MHDAAARVDEEYTGFCWYSWVDSNHRPPDQQSGYNVRTGQLTFFAH
jgi:hypothetical protein